MTKPRGYWNYNNCYELAKQCVSRSDFKRHNPSAYAIARKNGWLDEYIWFRNGFEIYYETGIKWTYKKTREESKKYTSRLEFCNNCVGGYTRALKQGWLDDFIWLKPKLIKEAKSRGNVYWVYVYIDEDNKTCYVGLSRDKARHWRHKQKDKTGKYDSVMSYYISIGMELPNPTILENNLTADQALVKEYEYCEYYKNLGYTLLNIQKPGSLGSSIVKWNEEACYNEALKYKTLKDFYTNNKAAYRNAKQYGWINNYIWLKRLHKQKIPANS